MNLNESEWIWVNLSESEWIWINLVCGVKISFLRPVVLFKSEQWNKKLALLTIVNHCEKTFWLMTHQLRPPALTTLLYTDIFKVKTFEKIQSWTLPVFYWKCTVKCPLCCWKFSRCCFRNALCSKEKIFLFVDETPI